MNAGVEILPVLFYGFNHFQPGFVAERPIGSGQVLSWTER